MKNKILKKMGIKLLAGSLVVTPIAAPLCTPMTVYAQDVIDRDCYVNEADGVIIQGGVTVATNKGVIDENLGHVSDNEGTISFNNGTGIVEINKDSGTIGTNNGSVVTNNGTINTSTEYGTVNSNDGTITTNKGTVISNNRTGIVDTNDGTVRTNNGTVTTNNSTVETNNGTVKTNTNTVTTNESSGKVVTNEREVKTNNGTVTTNKNSVKTNNGTIGANFGTVDSNTGTITDNFGTVTNNTGTITDNYGEATVEGGTVSNQWVLINTDLDAVNFNIETDNSIYSVGDTVRKKQIAGIGTETILDDEEAIYIRSGASAYLFAGDSNAKIIVPDETDATTKAFVDSGKLTYDSATNKSRVSLEGLTNKVVNLVFKILNKESAPQENPETPETPEDPVNPGTPAAPETPAAPAESGENQETQEETRVEETQPVNATEQVTPQRVVVANQTPVASAGITLLTTAPTTVGSAATAQTITMPPTTVANINAVIPVNAEAPTTVTSINIQTSNVERAGGSQTVTATANVTTVNGNINLSPQLVSGLTDAVSEQLGSKASKSVDIKVNTVAADGKSLSVIVNSSSLKNNATLKAYIKDPVTGGYVLTSIPDVKYNSKNGLTLSGLSGGNTYTFASAKEAKQIEQSILNSVKVSSDFANPVSVSAGGTVDMSKALSDGLNMTNVSKIAYTVSGNKAVIDPVTGKLTINGNATKGTITVSIKVTLKNGKTKTIKTKIKIG